MDVVKNHKLRSKPAGLVMFSAAFDKPVYGEGKHYQPRGRLHTAM